MWTPSSQLLWTSWVRYHLNLKIEKLFFIILVIPAPILTSIFFNYKMPAFMNYGSIGRVIGHEIQHGFGETGREVMLKNDEVVDWWTNATAEAFNVTKRCAIEEYERIPFTYKVWKCLNELFVVHNRYLIDNFKSAASKLVYLPDWNLQLFILFIGELLPTSILDSFKAFYIIFSFN